MYSFDQTQLDRLKTIAAPGPVLILTHDNPDPDALASGAGLAALLQQAWGISSRLVYSGLIARAENQAMLRLLTPEWEQTDALTNLGEYSALAMVDSQPGAGNNSLPAGTIPQIVLDHHHPIRESIQQVAYVDVQPEVGATVSLVYQHLAAAGIEPDENLATAMFYGLKTDTRGLARGASQLDEGVYVRLLPKVDRRKLILVEEAGLPNDYFRAFCRGLQAAKVYGTAIVSNLGEMHRPDLAAEMADMLIRSEQARAVLCLGQHGETLHFSIRTQPLGQDAGLIVQRIVVSPGKAGGHGTMAGGQVPLRGQDIDTLTGAIETRFLEQMEETGVGEALV
jgi:nanoRNase/pAp phosphatase (c-di-AMP/oligoRNAs hydrolase)